MMETWDKCNTFLRRIEEAKIICRDKDIQLKAHIEEEIEVKSVIMETTDEIELMGENSMESKHSSDTHRSGSLDESLPSAVSPIHFADVVLPTRLLAVQCVQLSDCSTALSALRCRLISMENDVDWVKESRW